MGKSHHKASLLSAYYTVHAVRTSGWDDLIKITPSNQTSSADRDAIGAAQVRDIPSN